MSFQSSASEAERAAAMDRAAGGGLPSSLASRQVPAILVSAPASGHGKTTVVAALARLLTRQGRRVRVFKYGPDFLDPVWHALASGAPVHNIDLWMTGEADIRQRLYQAAGEADFIIVEGVMGLYDGNPSAATLARLLGLPVMAVIDASRMAETFGALAHGLQSWMPGLRWAGALANRVASPRHGQMLAASSSAGTVASSYLGGIYRNEQFGLPSRHLGLIEASQLPDALARLDAAADALLDTALGQLDEARLSAWMSDFSPGATSGQPVPPLLAGRRIAIARDAAFSFIYPANIEVLQALGAALCFFSPLAGEALPECDALWLPGGYPELHAQVLAQCQTLAGQIAAHIAADKPVWAECGGMLPLFETLAFETRHWPMWGILPGHVSFQPRLAGLGMQQLDWPSPVGAGQATASAPAMMDGHAPLRGHTFHYSRCETPLPEVARSSRPGEARSSGRGEAVYRLKQLRASCFHAWFASNPARAAALFLPLPPEDDACTGLRGAA